MAFRGITVGSDQTLRRDGARFRNIGGNYPWGITPLYSQPSATACAYVSSSEQDAYLDLAVSMKMKALRVSLPYFPAQWTYGVNGGKTVAASVAADRAAYYAKVVAFMDKCAARDISVLLVIAFRPATIPDLVGETVRAGWLTNGSATRNFFALIVGELYGLLASHSAFGGWGLSNEWNHYNDCVDANMGGYPGVGAGTQGSYTAANTILNGSELSTVFAWMYSTIQGYDNQRIVLTGNGPNSYSRPGGAAGIATPMSLWHQEQVRDNPTNTGCAHIYFNIGIGSAGGRGLNPMLTGIRHWMKQAGKAFVFEEFGNQPWKLVSLNASSGVLTLVTAAADSGCPAEVGDEIQVAGTASVFDGLKSQIATISADRKTITAPCPINGSWSGAVKGLQYVGQARAARMCDDSIKSGTDLALWWMLDGDPLCPIWESLNYPGNEGQRAAITAANTSLGL